jgi:predicted nucleic-acid-binding protein
MRAGGMRAIDANVPVRLITQDDARQTEAAESFIANGAWVSVLALAEAAWVLTAVYGLSAKDLATVLEMLLHHRQLVVQDADAVKAALDVFRARQSPGFSDCLVIQLAIKGGHVPLGTFDRKLAKVEGARNV